MAAKVDLTTSTDWKEAKTYLKGLNQKQRREHYYTKDFVTLKDIDTWKKMAKSARLKQPEETKFPKDNHLNEKISLVRRDITKLEMDAIVNAGGDKGTHSSQTLKISRHLKERGQRARNECTLVSQKRTLILVARRWDNQAGLRRRMAQQMHGRRKGMDEWEDCGPTDVKIQNLNIMLN
ncbi:unnamed protein product [Caretta caretta]